LMANETSHFQKKTKGADSHRPLFSKSNPNYRYNLSSSIQKYGISGERYIPSKRYI